MKQLGVNFLNSRDPRKLNRLDSPRLALQMAEIAREQIEEERWKKITTLCQPLVRIELSPLAVALIEHELKGNNRE